MTSHDLRPSPWSMRRVLLLLFPLALLGTALLTLLAGPAAAGHPLTPPTGLSVSPGPAGKVTTPSWSYTLTEGDTALCSLTGPAGTIVPEGPCANPFVAPPLSPDGTYTFAVRSQRAASETTNADGSTTTEVAGTSEAVSSSYLLDTTSPSLSVAPPPPGPYTGWAVTVADATATQLSCALSGPATPPGFTCNAGTVSPELTVSGEYTLTVTASDAVGNPPTTRSASYVFDGDAPTVTITSAPTGRSNNPAVTWEYTVVDGPAPTCTLNGPTGSVGVQCGPTSYSTTLSASGDYSLTVTSVDAGGNVGRVTSGVYTLDITGPTVGVTPGNTTGTSSTIEWTVSLSGATSATCALSSGSTSTCINGSKITATLLRDGSITLTVTATDDLGNPGEATSTYTRNTAPAQVAVSAPTSPAVSKTVTWTITVGENTSAITCRLSHGATVVSDESCGPINGPGTYTYSSTLTLDGLYTLKVTASNTATSDVTTEASATYTLDTAEPAGPTLTQTHTGTSGKANPIGWTWTVLDGHTTRCRLTTPTSGQNWGPCTTSNSFSTATGTEGTYLLEVQYIDSLGNTGTVSSASYVYDSIGPVAPEVTLVGASPRPPGTVQWDVTTTGDVAFSECRIIGPGVDSTTVAWATCTLPIVRSLTGDGTHVVEVRHVDSAGNRSTVDTSSVVIDGTKPTAPTVTGGPTTSTDKTLTWTLAHTATDGASFLCRLLRNGSGPAEFTACASNYSVTVTQDGVYTLDVMSVDTAGNLSPVTTSQPRTVDTTGPTAPSVTLAVTSGKTKSATWSVTLAGDATRAECRLIYTNSAGTGTTGTWAACSGPYTFDLLQGDGVYELEVQSYDALGNVGGATVGPGYTLDATPPAAPVVTGNRDGQTDNERAVSYSYSGDGTATCSLYRDGVLVTPSGAVCGATTYTATLPATDGSYWLEVTFTDAFLNTGAPGVSGKYTLDVTPPAAPQVTGNRDGQTDNERAVSYSYSGEGTATCSLYRNGALVTPAGATCTATTYTATLPATDGTYRLEVTFTDAVGNTGLPGLSGNYVLDVTKPGLATVTVTPRTDNVERATWTVTAPESNTTSECRLTYTAGGVTTEVFGWKACAAPYTFDLRKGDGVYVLEVRLTDAVGNLGDVAVGESYTVDMTPPAVPTVTSNRTVKDNERTVTYTFSGEGTATCTIQRGTTVVHGPVTCTSTFTYELPDVSGTYILYVTYTDAVGNISDPGASPPYELDVTPPVQPVVSSDRSGTDNEPVVTYTFSGEGTATCTLMRGTTVVVAAQPCTSPWVVNLTYGDGTYHLLVTYTDAVGNTSTAGSSPLYTLDLTPPPAPSVSGPPATGNTRTVTWTYAGEGTATCTLLLDGVATGPAFGCGATSHSTTLPSDGSWTLQVTFTDAVGNTGPPGTSSPYLLDTVAPAAPRVAGPTGPSQNRGPSWTLSTDAGTTLECRLVRGGTVVVDWAACTGTFTASLTGQPDGAYVLESRATDTAGNLGAAGTSAPYVLDTTAPVAPVVSGASGPSQHRSPSFTWTGEAGTTAECQLSRDGAVVGGWVACSSGYAPALDRDGTWTVAVRLTDAAGNVGAAGTSGGYVLDTTAPATPTVTPPASPGRDLAPSWGAVVEGGTTAECRLTGPDGIVTAWAPCSLPHTTTLTGRPDGAYVLEVRVTDAAGNVSPIGKGTYVLDTVAPAAAVITSPSSPSRSRTPSFTFTTEAGATTRCRLTSGTTVISDFAPCTSPAGVDLTGLPDGTYTLTVRVTDAAGNPGPAATGTYVLDTEGPAAPVATLTPASPSSARSVTWAFSYEAGSTLVCRLTSPSGAVREIAGCTSPLTVDLTGLADGVYTLTVRAVDAAGNVGDLLTLTHTIDSTALAGPTVTGPATPGSTRTPTWSFTGGTTECRLVSGTAVLRDWSACSGSFTADLFGKPDGTYTLQVRTRTATAVSAATSSSYVLDTTAPAGATLTPPPTPSTNRKPTWSIASPELGAKAECRVLVFGSVLKDWAPCAVSAGGSLHTVDLTGLGDGTYTLVVRLTDAAGNRGPEVASAYVLDTSAPVAVGVTGPPSPGNDVTPTWTLSAGSASELECRLTSAAGVISDWAPCAGEYTADLTGLPDGTYTLSVRAVSAAGTPGPETTSAYVLNTSAPGTPVILTAPTTPSTNRSPTWTFSLPTGTTGMCRVVQGTRVVYDGPCTSPFTLDLSNAADGSYTLTIRALDAAGNLSEGTTSSYVLDTVPTAAPVFTQVPGATGSTLDPQWRFTVVRDATAECRLLYNGVALGDWAACASPYTAVLSGRPDGTYTLQVRAVDSAGNTSSPISHSYVLDRTAAPVATFDSTPTTPGTDTTVSWTFSAPDGMTLECRLIAPDGTTAWASCNNVTAGLRTTTGFNVSNAGTYRLDLAGRPDGAYVLEVRVVDADGRRGQASRATYLLDTQAPAAPRYSDTPASAGNDPQPVWLWDAPADELVECRLVRVGGSAVTGWAPCTSPYVADLKRLGEGVYALEIRLVDAAGNASAVTSASYRYDITPPAAPVFTARPPFSGSDRTVSWTFVVPTDTRATCTVTRDRTVIRESLCNGRYDLNLSGLPDGTYTLTVRYSDAAGNVSAATIGTYALSTLGVGGPIRVDRPAPPRTNEPQPVGGATAPSGGPGRGGTGTALPASRNSTPRASVPTIRSGDDVLRGSADRPSASVSSGSGKPSAPGSKAETGGGSLLLPRQLPVEDVPEVLGGLVTETIKRPTLPLALLAIVLLFLLAQNRIDRRDPKLASAPVEAEPELDFTVFVRRPGGALS